jgi:AcrR family transcriptional regulator
MFKTWRRLFNASMQMQHVPAGAPRGERRQSILLAAERLFAQHGYRGVTIRQIAARAGVPLALVGYYFGPKHELFHAVFEQWRHTVDERLALLQQACNGPAGSPRLRAIVAAFVEPVPAQAARGRRRPGPTSSHWER